MQLRLSKLLCKRGMRKKLQAIAGLLLGAATSVVYAGPVTLLCDYANPNFAYADSPTVVALD